MNKNQRDLLFGTRAITEAILSGKEIDKLFLQKGLSNPLIKELIQTARKHNIAIITVPVEKLNRITRKNHQGAIAFVAAVTFQSLDNIIEQTYSEGREPFLLILDRITDVRNLGAIARTAECAGVDALIVPTRGSAAINADAMKTSAGALNYLPVCRSHNLKETLHFLQSSGIRIVACTEKTETSLFDLPLDGPVAILMGSEEDGISPEYLKMADIRARIPMFGNIESLNVSVSAAVILYEVVKHRRKQSKEIPAP